MCRRQTHFTNGLDPQPHARSTFAFHRAEALAEWLDSAQHQVREAPADYHERGKTFLARLRHMPPLRTECLWPAQIKANNNLEKSLRENRPRALIQMGERRPSVQWTNAASRTTRQDGEAGASRSHKCRASEGWFALPRSTAAPPSWCRTTFCSKVALARPSAASCYTNAPFVALAFQAPLEGPGSAIRGGPVRRGKGPPDLCQDSGLPRPCCARLCFAVHAPLAGPVRAVHGAPVRRDEGSLDLRPTPLTPPACSTPRA
jgi:hypothetical protein